MSNEARYNAIVKKMQTLRSEHDRAKGELEAALRSLGVTTLEQAEAKLNEATVAEQNAAAVFEELLADYEARYGTVQG